MTWIARVRAVLVLVQFLLDEQHPQREDDCVDVDEPIAPCPQGTAGNRERPTPPAGGPAPPVGQLRLATGDAERTTDEEPHDRCLRSTRRATQQRRPTAVLDEGTRGLSSQLPVPYPPGAHTVISGPPRGGDSVVGAAPAVSVPGASGPSWWRPGLRPRPGAIGQAAYHPELTELDPGECWARLSTHGVGRISVSTPEGPAIVPVNYTVVDGAVAFSTARGTTPALAAGAEAAFEVDHIDEALSEGWSVLVVGRAEWVTDPAATRHLVGAARSAGGR